MQPRRSRETTPSGIVCTNNMIIAIIMALLVIVCLVMGFYLGGLMAEMQQLRSKTQNLLQGIEKKEKMLKKNEEELKICQENAVSNCQTVVKEERARCDEYFKKFKNEVDKGQNQLKNEQYDNFAEFKDNYRNWAETKLVEHSNCTHSYNECQKQLREQGEAARQNASDLVYAKELCKIKMEFKDIQLKECQSRLNKTIEVLKSKGVEPV